jgi:hypothetical protein
MILTHRIDAVSDPEMPFAMTSGRFEITKPYISQRLCPKTKAQMVIKEISSVDRVRQDLTAWGK